jgi:ParB-like chromosome segregation protein Spo0J
LDEGEDENETAGGDGIEVPAAEIEKIIRHRDGRVTVRNSDGTGQTFPSDKAYEEWAGATPEERGNEVKMGINPCSLPDRAPLPGGAVWDAGERQPLCPAGHSRLDELRGKTGIGATAAQDAYPWHEITTDWADFTPPEADRMKQSLREHGLLMPIVTWNGFRVDGRHRDEYCVELGIGRRYIDITEACPTEDQMRAHVAALNWARRSRTEPLTTAEKQARIEAALVKDPERSDRAIAKEVGVHNETVANTRKRLESEGLTDSVTPPSERKSRRGKKGEGQRTNTSQAAAQAESPAVKDTTAERSSEPIFEESAAAWFGRAKNVAEDAKAMTKYAPWGTVPKTQEMLVLWMDALSAVAEFVNRLREELGLAALIDPQTLSMTAQKKRRKKRRS